MKSTLSKLQIKMLLDGKTLSFGHKKIYISKDSNVYEILSEAYNDKYWAKRVMLDTEDKGFVVEGNWRISWSKPESETDYIPKIESETDYIGEYNFADKSVKCRLIRTRRFEEGYIHTLYVLCNEDGKWYPIMRLRIFDTDTRDIMFQTAEYGLIAEFRKADEIGIPFDQYLKEHLYYVSKI